MSARPILVADCVARSFGARGVLSAATLRAVPGEVRALFGRNGEGKSTLLRIAVGLLAPDGGSVFWEGEALERATLPALARRGLCFLPDEGMLSPALPLGLQLAAFAQRFDGGDPDDAADRLRIRDLLAERPATFSGGERRRADLAAALVRAPRCLVTDEPFRGVAPQDAELMTAIHRELAAAGCAVVATGHEAPTLLAAADHVTWCVGGTTYELGTPAAALAHERFVREYLGPGFRRREGPQASPEPVMAPTSPSSSPPAARPGAPP